MKIKVLGPGCPFCKKLHEMTINALAELGVAAEVEHINDWKQILSYIPATPGLVINEKVKHYGKPLPSLEKVKQLISEERETSSQ
ncbi:MAG: thioredoxin family protein [candidate division NC10 bacterium]|nr:thioredoxin family protein [candidate division NC10 bacterium]